MDDWPNSTRAVFLTPGVNELSRVAPGQNCYAAQGTNAKFVS